MQVIKVGLAGVLLATTAACGGSTPPTDAQPTPPAQQTPQTPAQAFQQAAQQAPTTPVDFEKLIALLPAPAGWTRSQPKGGQLSMGVAYSNAEAEYEKGESSIHLQIIDTSFNQLVLAPFTMMMNLGFAERSTEGYKKAAPVGGSPGYETWENGSKVAEVTVLVGNRIIVTAKGRNVDNAEAVRSLVGSVDQGKLRDLK